MRSSTPHPTRTKRPPRISKRAKSRSMRVLVRHRSCQYRELRKMDRDALDLIEKRKIPVYVVAEDLADA